MLHEPPDFQFMALADEPRLGLFVVAQLAARHGIRVTLTPSPAYGGTRVVVLLPMSVVAGLTEEPLALAGRPTEPEQRRAWLAELPPARVVAPAPPTEESAETPPETPQETPREPRWSDLRPSEAPVQAAVPDHGESLFIPASERISAPPSDGAPGRPSDGAPGRPWDGAPPGGAAPVAVPVPVPGQAVHHDGGGGGPQTPGSPELPPEAGSAAAPGPGRPALPRRSPQSHLSPRLKDEPRPATSEPMSDPQLPDPELARDRMSALQRGTIRGRATDPEASR
jgi:hypothetical protein